MTQILTTQDYRNMPWKNGQGSTLELARSHGEGLDDFDWRVSIADVKTAGSFSFFQIGNVLLVYWKEKDLFCM